MGSVERKPVRRHHYRCPDCGIASHEAGDVEDEKEIDCTVCGYEGPAEYVGSRTAMVPIHLVQTGDEIVMDYHDSDVDAEPLQSHEADRECPVCLKDRLCSPWEAERVFMTSGWGATSMLEDAEKVCSFCHSVLIDGRWQRMETVDSRAYKLAQASSTKRTRDYRDILTRGIETGKDNPEAEDAQGW